MQTPTKESPELVQNEDSFALFSKSMFYLPNGITITSPNLWIEL
jgi:hypothetical protein